jgi:hypothetical protein
MNKEMYGSSPMFGIHLALKEITEQNSTICTNDSIEIV